MALAVINRTDVDYDLLNPPDGSREKQLYCRILLTFFEDIDHMVLMRFKYGSKPRNTKCYADLHPHIALHSLVTQAKSDHCKALCDMAEINHSAFLNSFLNYIEENLGKRLH